jgi:hypothetical protein
MGQKSRTPSSSSSPTSKTSAPSSGLHYSNIIYAFIFIMYAVVICVVIFMLTSRWVFTDKKKNKFSSYTGKGNSQWSSCKVIYD